MPIVPVSEFKSSLKPGAKLLGLDISKTSIGIAFGDVETGIVTPVTVINRKRLKDDAEQLIKLIGEYGTKSMIVGWPLHMDGSEGKRCQAVRDTVLELQKSMQAVKFVFWDERLSTAKAHNLVEEIGITLGKGRGKPVDNHAAMVILESFLDSLSPRERVGVRDNGPE